MRRENITSLISRKVESYNKAEKNGNTRRRLELRQELAGMQQLLECMGIWLILTTDKEFMLHYSFEP